MSNGSPKHFETGSNAYITANAQRGLANPPQMVLQTNGMRGMPQNAGVMGGRGYFMQPQPVPWLPSPSVLRDMVASQGPGAYRLHMTVSPPVPVPGSTMRATKSQTGFQEIHNPAGSEMIYNYNNMPLYSTQQQFVANTNAIGQMSIPPSASWGNTYHRIEQASNPALGTPVEMYHTAAGSGNIRPCAPEGPKKKSRKRKRNNPKGPKPARYAWNFYFKEKYQQLRKDGGRGLFDVQEAFTKVGLRLGNAWKALDAEGRKPYMEMAAKDRLRHEREMELFSKGLDFSGVSAESSTADASKESKHEEPEAAATDGEAHNKPSLDREPVKDSKGAQAEADEGDKSQVVSETGSENRDTPLPEVAHEVTADILVTDDDATFMLMMEATLKRIHKNMNGKVNLNIHKAMNGSEALEKVIQEQQKFAVITMDKELGDDKLDGIETVKKIREAGYNGFVVGLSSSDCAESFESNGADATLTKGQSHVYSQIYDYVIEKIQEKETAHGTSLQEKHAMSPLKDSTPRLVANKS